MILIAIISWTLYHIPILCASFRSRTKNLNDDPQSNGLPRISLLIPAKDEERVIGRCLESLLGLDYPREKMEMIVIDGNSRDATLETCLKVQCEYPDVVKVLRQADGRGKPAALNLALPHATGDIVGVFDADNIADRGALRRIASSFRDPHLAAMQGRPLSLNEGQNMLTKIAAKERRAWFQALLMGRARLGLFVPLTGSCQFIRRSLLVEAGGWSEESLAEDVELALNLLEAGHCVEYAPEVCSWEETPGDPRDLVRQRMRWYRGYMEATIRYGRLLKNPNRRKVDAEVLLMGPYLMVLCMISYITWALNIVFPSSADYLLSPSVLAVVLTALTLFALGVQLTFLDRPLRLGNLLWIPFIYVYWLIQTFIAVWAFVQIILARPRVWEKTGKKGSVTVGNLSTVS